ncbi:MAG: hypothetical protein VXW32_12415, partial [Myxococcota bacterium]|nr:hypothetical protein [Myxococcota bacterium]
RLRLQYFHRAFERPPMVLSCRSLTQANRPTSRRASFPLLPPLTQLLGIRLFDSAKLIHENPTAASVEPAVSCATQKTENLKHQGQLCPA